MPRPGLTGLATMRQVRGGQIGPARLYEGIDLPETLSNLLGKRIRRILPGSPEFEDGEVLDLTKQGLEFFKLIKPMVWWQQRR